MSAIRPVGSSDSRVFGSNATGISLMIPEFPNGNA